MFHALSICAMCVFLNCTSLGIAKTVVICGCRQVAERCSRSKILRCVFREKWAKTEISNIQLSCIRISSAHLVNQKKRFRIKYWLGKNGILIFTHETFHVNEMNVKQPAFQPMVDYSTCWLLQVAMSRMEKQTS